MSNPNPVGQFKPGVVTNPNGRPKKEFALTETLKDILREKDPTTKVERYKMLMEKALSMAMRGDGDMLKYLINRIEGMPKQPSELTGEDGKDLTFNVILTNGNKVTPETIRTDGGQPQIQSN